MRLMARRAMVGSIRVSSQGAVQNFFHMRVGVPADALLLIFMPPN